MNDKQHFEKHYSKLRLEALILSLIFGSIFGFFAGFVAAFSTWFPKDLNGMWISLATIFGVTAICTTIYYFKKFRPTAMRNAQRIDRLGLEERLITMVEYETDNSFVAAIQREDAKQKLAEVSPANIRIRLPKTKTMVTLIISFVLCAAMTTVTTLSDFGIIKSGLEFLEDLVEQATGEEQIKYISVTYDVEGGGSIDGESDQLLPLLDPDKGASSEMIVAVADDGWEFVEWDDGYKKPARSDKGLKEDVVFVAIFMQMDQESQDGQPTDSSDQEQDKQQPKEDQEQQQQDQQQQPDEQDKESQSPMGGGKYEEANQIIDGETYYREVKQLYKEMLLERLETEGDQLSPEERAIIEAYLEIV